uniref:Uncharacterized protein n=1 Tax=Anopheles culicifacies TaxID=139723 RepID=A0A182MNB4_9DIPT
MLSIDLSWRAAPLRALTRDENPKVTRFVFITTTTLEWFRLKAVRSFSEVLDDDGFMVRCSKPGPGPGVSVALRNATHAHTHTDTIGLGFWGALLFLPSVVVAPFRIV